MRSTESAPLPSGSRETVPAPHRPAGQSALVLLGLAVGILLMAVQLWLLTLAFNLYLLGERRGTLIAAIVSGVIFLGGLAMLRVLRAVRRPRR